MPGSKPPAPDSAPDSAPDLSRDSPSEDRSWKAREAEIAALAPGVREGLLCRVESESTCLRVYVCTGVSALVDYLRDHTRAAELGAQHHVLKIVFKHLAFGTRGKMEFTRGSNRFDIYFNGTRFAIEVRTIVHITTERARKHAQVLIESGRVDRAWVFYFLKFRRGAPRPRPGCKYLLVWLDLDLITDEETPLEDQVIAIVEEGQAKAARELGVKREILIPVDNIIRAEDFKRQRDEYKRENEEYKRALAEKERALAEKERALAEKERALAEKERALAEKEAEIARLRETHGLNGTGA